MYDQREITRRELEQDKVRARTLVAMEELKANYKSVDPFVCRDKFDWGDHPLLICACITVGSCGVFTFINALFG